MTIKIFVDWRNEEILTEEEHNKRAEELAEEFRTSDYDFSEFLKMNYSHRELWDANEEERAEIMEDWAYRCLDEAYDALGFEEVELEV